MKVYNDEWIYLTYRDLFRLTDGQTDKQLDRGISRLIDGHTVV
jgi:hypothetical protein